MRDKIKKNSLLIVDGYPMRIRGENDSNSIFKSNVQLVLKDDLYETIRCIEKYLDKGKEYEVSEKYDRISHEKLMKLYDDFIDKLEKSIFSKRPANQIKNLQKGREVFLSLALGDKAKITNEILNMFRCDNATTANLTMINGSANAGSIKVNKNTLGKSRVVLVNQSVTGLFENRIEL